MLFGFGQVSAERAREREERRRRLRRRFLFFWFLLIIVTVFYIILHPIWFIRDIQINGTQSLSANVLAQEVAAELTGKNLFIFPRQSLFFFPKIRVAQKLLDAYPRISTVRVSVKGFDQLVIEIEERGPALVGCSGRELPRECFYIDQFGILFEPAPVFSVGVYPTIIGEVMTAANLDHRVLETEEVKTLPQFFAELNQTVATRLQADFLVADASMLPQQDMEVFFYRRSDQTDRWRVLFNRQNDLAKTLFYADSVLMAETFQADWSKSPEALEYIDARFGKKIFYRFSTYATATTATH